MKYTGKTIIEIAQKRGSAAKTKAGAWKYLLAHLGKQHEGLHNIRVGYTPYNPSQYTHRYRWEGYWEDRRRRTGDGRALVLGYDLNDPNTPGRILEEAWEINRQWDADCNIAIERDRYGEIYRNTNAASAKRPRAEVAEWHAAWKLIEAAEGKNIIPATYDTIEFDCKGRADGDALHHDLYDFGKNAAIICIRRTEGTRYGVKTLSKLYMLIESYRRKITAREITIPVAKYAKMGILHFGDICQIAQGKKQVKLINASNKIRHGYKAVRITEDGTYESVWDGSKWELGKERVEKALPDHNGGLYYYEDMQSMIRAAKENAIFAPDMQHHRLAVLEVEATGVHISYGKKLAATRIKPLREVAAII